MAANVDDVDQDSDGERARMVLLDAALEGLEDVAAGRVLTESELDRLLANPAPGESTRQS